MIDYKIHIVKNWNEEVIKWMAVALCLGLLAMAVMPTLSQSHLYGEYMLHKNMR